MYRGWMIVFSSFLTYMIVWGGVWYSFSVFYNIFVRDFHWGRGETAGVFSLCVSIVFLSGPLVGRLLDRFGPKRILAMAAILLVVSLVLCSRMHSILEFYLYYGIGCAIGMSFLLFTAQTSLISRWFQIYRGTALGIAASGAGVGMMIFVPLVQQVATETGWRAGFLLLGGLVFFLVLPVNFISVRFPFAGEEQNEGGLLSWTGNAQIKRPTTRVIDASWASKIWTIREALKTGRFWYMSVAGISGALVIQTIFSHFIVMTTDTSRSAALASKMLGLSGIMGTAGFLFWGRVADRIGRERAYTLGTLSLLTGLLALFVMKWVPGIHAFVIFAALFGFGYGSRAPLMQSICADIFQGPHFSSVFGMYQMSISVSILFPWIVGVTVGFLGSYQPVIVFLMGSLILSCWLVWLAAPRKVRRYEVV
jgi:MFS family permease